MFIERQHYPTFEFDPAAGQQEPTIAYFLSNLVDPLKSALPLLAEGGNEERVLVGASPLSELLDETIRLHREAEYPDMVVDEKHRAFLGALQASLEQALAKLGQIQLASMDDGEDDDT